VDDVKVTESPLQKVNGPEFEIVGVVGNGLTTTFTATGLTAGTTYTFVVQSLNDYDYSVYSNVVNILAAQKPSAPL
jgi:hypothetical protein